MVNGLQKEVIIRGAKGPLYRVRCWSRLRTVMRVSTVSGLETLRCDATVERWDGISTLPVLPGGVAVLRGGREYPESCPEHAQAVPRRFGLPWAVHSVVEAGSERPRGSGLEDKFKRD